MRYADEIVDNPGLTTLDEQLAALEAFEEETLAAMTGEEVPNPVLRACANTARERGIGPENIAAFMKSMKMDTHVFRYPTYEDLAVYTYGSAAVVGLMMCRVLGVADERAGEHAEALGVAMQLSNFLRDIGEDWRRGRVYLPLEDLGAFGVTREQLGDGVVDGRVRRLLAFEVGRTRELYRSAQHGVRLLHPTSRPCIETALALYGGILDEIERADYAVLGQRVAVGPARRAAVALPGLARAWSARRRA